MTEEMRAILDSKEQHMVIQAYSGCGKSTTMLEYVKEHSDEKILFLVYNKEMQLDFSKRAQSVVHNTRISTIHSIAFRWYMKTYNQRKEFKNISAIDVESYFSHKKFRYDELSKIKFYLDMFLCSSYETPYELTPLVNSDKKYFKYVEVLWNYYSKSSPVIAHNVYLKLFQLSKPKLDYETIIFDEFNDVNGVMIDILLNNLDKKIIVVGDSYQNLNSFNHTVSGLNMLVEDYGFKEYGLTESFRISNRVANLSSRYLSYMYDTDINFRGIKDTKIGKLNLLDATSSNQMCLLCRTRLGGIKEISFVLDMDKNKKIYYSGGLDSFGIREIEKVIAYGGYIYLGGKRLHINSARKMINKGLEDADAQRTISLYDFVSQHPCIIDLLRQTETKYKSEADIIVQTAHSSKGLTLENVVIGRDFKPVEEIKAEYDESILDIDKTPFERNLAKSEINLLYVAITRATGTVDIGSSLRRSELLQEGDKISVGLDY